MSHPVWTNAAARFIGDDHNLTGTLFSVAFISPGSKRPVTVIIVILKLRVLRY